MKNEHLNIIGNDDLYNYFTLCAKDNSLSHAYVLLGSKGTGKHTLAKIISAAVNCEKRLTEDIEIPCQECNSCRKIFSDNSADIIYISREKDKVSLGIEPIRFIKTDIVLYPNDGDFKIYIIEDAHTMTIQAQNALLLTLEEPPPYVIFILLCENTETLLETIRSRAPILRMKIPQKSETIEYLKENHPSARTIINNSPDEFNEIYMASGGSIGRILELITSNERKQILQKRDLVQKLVEAIAHRTISKDFGEIFSLFPQKREDREKLLSILSDLECALRDLMVVKKADEPNMTFFTDREYAEELSYSISVQRISKILALVENARLSILRSANIKLTLTNLLSNLI
jgi:DNA polymerase-3 subunit delta'